MCAPGRKEKREREEKEKFSYLLFDVNGSLYFHFSFSPLVCASCTSNGKEKEEIHKSLGKVRFVVVILIKKKEKRRKFSGTNVIESTGQSPFRRRHRRNELLNEPIELPMTCTIHLE